MDVELAIDLVQDAMDDVFDVAVLASADTDLVPALRLVAQRFPGKHLVTLGYAPLSGREGRCPQPLDLAEYSVERRFITKRDFERIADRRNFYESAADESGQIEPGRWQRIQNRLH